MHYSHKWGSGAELRVLTSNSSIKPVDNKGSNGGSHGSTMDLLVILTLEEKVCIFEAKLQQCDNLLSGHVGPLEECWILV